MELVHLMIVIASLQYIFFLLMVGKARETYSVKAPAVSGNEMFERYFRVQMNTLENLVIFLPIMFLTPLFFNPLYVAILGAIFIIGRAVYYIQYLKEPSKRTLGFALTIGPIVCLLGMCLFGAIRVIIMKGSL